VEAPAFGCYKHGQDVVVPDIDFTHSGRVVHRYTMSKQSGHVTRRVCTCALVHYEQTVRPCNAAGLYGCTGTL